MLTVLNNGFHCDIAVLYTKHFDHAGPALPSLAALPTSLSSSQLLSLLPQVLYLTSVNRWDSLGLLTEVGVAFTGAWTSHHWLRYLRKCLSLLQQTLATHRPQQTS